jgi:hypothetical protein
VTSFSSLSVIEHVGLGRYGDPLNPAGSRAAAAELARVLAPNGRLYIALPVGVPRVLFNAHRVHSYEQVLDLFAPLKLLRFGLVDSDGHYHPDADPSLVGTADHPSGLFLFSK